MKTEAPIDLIWDFDNTAYDAEKALESIAQLAFNKYGLDPHLFATAYNSFRTQGKYPDIPKICEEIGASVNPKLTTDVVRRELLGGIQFEDFFDQGVKAFMVEVQEHHRNIRQILVTKGECNQEGTGYQQVKIVRSGVATLMDEILIVDSKADEYRRLFVRANGEHRTIILVEDSSKNIELAGEIAHEVGLKAEGIKFVWVAYGRHALHKEGIYIKPENEYQVLTTESMNQLPLLLEGIVGGHDTVYEGDKLRL